MVKIDRPPLAPILHQVSRNTLVPLFWVCLLPWGSYRALIGAKITSLAAPIATLESLSAGWWIYRSSVKGESSLVATQAAGRVAVYTAVGHESEAERIRSEFDRAPEDYDERYALFARLRTEMAQLPSDYRLDEVRRVVDSFCSAEEAEVARLERLAEAAEGFTRPLAAIEADFAKESSPSRQCSELRAQISVALEMFRENMQQADRQEVLDQRREQEVARFEQLAAELNCQLVSVSDDGDCLFHALAAARQIQNPPDLRIQIAAELRRGGYDARIRDQMAAALAADPIPAGYPQRLRTLRQRMVPDWQEGFLDRCTPFYCRMVEEGLFGGEIELEVWARLIGHCSVVVHSIDGDQPPVGEGEETIHICHYGGAGHFNALVPIEPEPVVPPPATLNSDAPRIAIYTPQPPSFFEKLFNMFGL